MVGVACCRCRDRRLRYCGRRGVCNSNLVLEEPTLVDVDRMVELSKQTYTEFGERAALRCALGDAAAMCDGLARDIAAENTIRGAGKTVTKRGLELEAVAKRCGDAIWAMREKISVTDDEN